MRLDHWTHSQKAVVFDRKTGEAETIQLSEPRSEDHHPLGWSVSEKPLFGQRINFALVREPPDLLFYAGNTSWNLCDDSIDLRHVQFLPFMSKFEIWQGDKLVFTITYHHFLRLLGLIVDVTYDGLDRDADFFLEFVAHQSKSRDWVEHVLEPGA